MSKDTKNPYRDPRTGVAKNKWGITDSASLRKKETVLSASRYKAIRKNKIEGKFDQAHLQNIHKYLLQDTYTWAGKLKVIGLKKEGDPPFPYPGGTNKDTNLQLRLDDAFDQLAKDNKLQGITDNDVFVNKLAGHVSDIWEAHAFPDGNTRAIAMFTELLVTSTGREVAKDFPPKEFRESLKVSALYRDDRQLQFVLKKAIINKQALSVKEDSQSAKYVIQSTAANRMKMLCQPLDKEQTALAENLRLLKQEYRESKQESPSFISRGKHDVITEDLKDQVDSATRALYNFKADRTLVERGLRAESKVYARQKHPREAEKLAQLKKQEREQKTGIVRSSGRGR